MIDDKALAEMEARMQAATQGPWKHDNTENGWHWLVTGPAFPRIDDDIILNDDEAKKEDLTFSAHAREDMEALIAEVRGLRGKNDIAERITDEAVSVAMEKT